jgi:hypothetical protein
MELGAEIERGLIEALLGHRRVQVQVIATTAAPEAGIHLPFHLPGVPSRAASPPGRSFLRPLAQRCPQRRMPWG